MLGTVLHTIAHLYEMSKKNLGPDNWFVLTVGDVAQAIKNTYVINCQIRSKTFT